MTTPATFNKQPFEEYNIAIEYSGKLPSGTSLSTGTVSAVDTSTGATDNSVLSGTSATIAGTQAKIKVIAGVANKKYAISFKVTLNDGQKLEDDVLMHVIES